MKPAAEHKIAEIRQSLNGLPPLRKTFDYCLQAFRQRSDLALVLKGSLKNGNVDRFSDIDFALVMETDDQVAAHRDWVRGMVSSAGRLLVHFPATHLGMQNLLVSFLEVDGVIVKVDVEILSRDEFRSSPSGLVLHDPHGTLAALRQGAENGTAAWSPEEFADLHQKFSGWIWYTYTKIARGELLEAIDSLGVMRSRALLPCLQLVTDLPLEGYRRLEERLAPEALAALRRTYPANHHREAILDALMEMVACFSALQPQVAQRLGKPHQAGDLNAIVAAVRRSEGDPAMTMASSSGQSAEL